MVDAPSRAHADYASARELLHKIHTLYLRGIHDLARVDSGTDSPYEISAFVRAQAQGLTRTYVVRCRSSPVLMGSNTRRRLVRAPVGQRRHTDLGVELVT
jgi:hypothetical protein